jgi:hypothetical protein
MLFYHLPDFYLKTGFLNPNPLSLNRASKSKNSVYLKEEDLGPKLLEVKCLLLCLGLDTYLLLGIGVDLSLLPRLESIFTLNQDHICYLSSALCPRGRTPKKVPNLTTPVNVRNRDKQIKSGSHLISHYAPTLQAFPFLYFLFPSIHV